MTEQPTVYHFLEGQNYDCVQCGKACLSDWHISVDPTTRRNLSGSTLELRVIQDYGAAWQEGGASDDPHAIIGESFVAQKANGECVFLQPDLLCGIHAERGYAAKPVVCRMYPFEPVPTPDGMFVSVSFRCTAVQQNHGRPLKDHQEDIVDLLKLVRLHTSGFEPKEVYAQVSMDWDGYKALERFVMAQLDSTDPQQAVGQAIWALCEEIAVAGASPRLLDGPIMEAALLRQQPGRLESDSMVSASTQFVLLTTLAFLEVQPAERRALVETISSGRPFQLPRWGWDGTLDQLQATQQQLVGSAFESEIRRYLRSLLFGKQLLQGGPLLSGLSALYLLPQVVRLYTAVFAARHQPPGSAEVLASSKDFFQAIDICETELVTHAHGMNNFFAPFARSFVGQVGVLLRP